MTETYWPIDPDRGAHGDAPSPPASVRPARRSRRVALVTVVATLLLAAAGVGTWTFLRAAPELTWHGQPIADPERLLTSAQTRLTALVDAQGGVTGRDTRCWFAPTDSGSEVGARVYCGPALFVDGGTDRPYVPYAVRVVGTSDRGVTLAVAGDAAVSDAVAAPTGRRLVRPDGRTPPPGAGGLAAPRPPAADRDLLLAVPPDAVTLPAAPAGAAMGARQAGVRIAKLGSVARFGHGADARRAPSGGRLIGFALVPAAGAFRAAIPDVLQLQVVVDGGTPRPVPDAIGTNVVAVPASAHQVDLLTGADGVVQSVSLLDGRPAAGNIAVLGRDNRAGGFTAPSSFVLSESDGGVPVPRTCRSIGNTASLGYWAGSTSATTPSGVDRAFLLVDLSFELADPDPTLGESADTTYRLQPQLLTLSLPDGTRVSAAEFDGRELFDVPATFTTGQLTISGQVPVGSGITLSVVQPVSFAVTVA